MKPYARMAPIPPSVIADLARALAGVVDLIGGSAHRVADPAGTNAAVLPPLARSLSHLAQHPATNRAAMHLLLAAIHGVQYVVLCPVAGDAIDDGRVHVESALLAALARRLEVLESIVEQLQSYL